MAIGIGVELDPLALRGVVLERSGKQLKLLAVHEASCETSNLEALTRTLTQLRRTLHIARPIVLGIPSTSAILTTVTPLVANPRRAALAVQFELQQHLPFELTDAVWHYGWLSSGKNGDALTGRSRLKARTSSLQQQAGAVVAAMRRSLLDERLACCRRAGLSVQAVAVNAVATLNVWDTGLATRQAGVPSGTGEARVTLLNLTSNEQVAEWIVWTPASLQVVPVMSPSPETLWQDLVASWEALRAQSPDVPTPVWVVGHPASFLQLQGVLTAQLGLQVERFDATRVVATGPVQWEHPERSVAALGLALQGLEVARVPLNLLASSQGEERSRRVRRVAAMTSVICALATFGFGLSGMMEVRGRHLRTLQSLQRQERLYQTLRPEVRALIQRQQHTQRRSLQVERLVGEALVLTQLLAQLAEALPDQVWLTTLECSKSEASIDGLLEGRAKSFQDVTQFLDRLKNVAGMTTVKPLSTSVMTDQTSGKEVVVFAVQIQRPLVTEH
jgi:Tfp pilus assembly protein PilN/Tfp pilus assembly PilM family ATPase